MVKQYFFIVNYQRPLFSSLLRPWQDPFPKTPSRCSWHFDAEVARGVKAGSASSSHWLSTAPVNRSHDSSSCIEWKAASSRVPQSGFFAIQKQNDEANLGDPITNLKKDILESRGALEWRRCQLCSFLSECHQGRMCLFSDDGMVEFDRVELPEHSNDVWHGYPWDWGGAAVWVQSTMAPLSRKKGHRFIKQAVLDPYAYAHLGEVTMASSDLWIQMESEGDLTFDERDSAPLASVSSSSGTLTSAENADRKSIHWTKPSFTEVHVKGFTKLREDIPMLCAAPTRGGATARDRLWRSLGVTSVELLPIHNLPRRQPSARTRPLNYWGYTAFGFFCA